MNTCGNKLFKQVTGNRMASDLAPFFLYYQKSKFIKKIKKADIRRAGRFANTFTFIDGFAMSNYGSEFERSFRDIHPPGVEFQKENYINIEGSFFGSGH